MREHGATDFVAPTLFAQPGCGDEGVPLGRASLEVWIALVIHVVQEADRFPKVSVGTARRGEMPHRIRHGITMFAQALGLNPLVQNG